MAGNDFLSFKQVIAEYPIASGTFRRWLFNRHENGLVKAVLQRDRKLIFKRDKLENWLETYLGKRS